MNHKKSSNRLIIVVIILLLLLVLCMGVYIIILSNHRQHNAIGMEIGSQNKIEQFLNDAPMDEVEEDEMLKDISIPGRSKIILKADSLKQTIEFFNPKENEDNFYLTYRLSIGDEVLYQSGYIKPGEYIYDVTLSRKLDKGYYAGEIFVQPYYIKDESPLNNVSMSVGIIVE